MVLARETGATGRCVDVVSRGVAELVMEHAPSATNTADDPRWMLAARKGESWALEAMYDEYKAPVYGLCFRLLCRVDDAEDCVQAAFIQAFRALPKFRGDSSVKSWLFRIAVNQATDILRKRKRSPAELDFEPAIPDSSRSVAERLAVMAALGRLKTDHRVVLILRFWQELSYEDIAGVLDAPLSTVKMRIKRAKDEFRSAYEERQ